MFTATSEVRRHVGEHYAQSGYTQRLLAALEAAGKRIDRLTRDDLTSFEEFHIGGRDATRELARRAGLQPATHVLDLGCGIGGPARTLADEFGCRVTGVDLVDEFIEAARELTARTGLAGRIAFKSADACALPYVSGAFDAVFSEHMTMNVADKATLFTEVRRVLREGGLYALYEICAGVGEVQYPTPWASTPAISFLEAPDQLRRQLEAAGLEVRDWEDVSAQAAQRFAALAANVASKDGNAPALGPRLVMGPNFAEKIGNLRRNLDEGRVRVVAAILTTR